MHLSLVPGVVFFLSDLSVLDRLAILAVWGGVDNNASLLKGELFLPGVRSVLTGVAPFLVDDP